MEKEKIRYLGQKEKQSTRAMYEAIFPEDSREFVDYYYDWKTKENEILVMETDEKFCQVMMHLNPYTLWINGNLQEVPYIVAVATHPDCRRQGKMQQVMKRALKDMERKQIPFTFLLPADPAYYEGQGFVYFPCQKQTRNVTNLQSKWIACSSAVRGADSYGTWKRAEEQDIPEMEDFANEVLKKQYHIFVKRDVCYYRRLLVETAVEHGGVLLLKAKGNIHGILVYGVEETYTDNDGAAMNLHGGNVVKKAEIKELLLCEAESFVGDTREAVDVQGKWIDKASGLQEKEALCRKALPDCEVTFGTARMMVRITSLFALVPFLRSEKYHCFKVTVKDSMIEANNGSYQIETDAAGGRIEKIPQEQTEQELDMAELTRILLADTPVHLNEWV